MAFTSLRDFFAQIGVATPDQFDTWNKAWRTASEAGSQETLLAFMCRERGITEEFFLQQLAKALNWPFLDLPKTDISSEARNKISTKVAFQHSVIPINT